MEYGRFIVSGKICCRLHGHCLVFFNCHIFWQSWILYKDDTMSGQLNIIVRPQTCLDAKWLKSDLQCFLTRDGLADLWNGMVRDGEIVRTFSDGLINSAGIVARKGTTLSFLCLYLFQLLYMCQKDPNLYCLYGCYVVEVCVCTKTFNGEVHSCLDHRVTSMI